ncbi:atrophin-1 isoform X2 [Balamuthia mandrillaris]
MFRTTKREASTQALLTEEERLLAAQEEEEINDELLPYSVSAAASPSSLRAAASASSSGGGLLISPSSSSSSSYSSSSPSSVLAPHHRQKSNASVLKRLALIAGVLLAVFGTLLLLTGLVILVSEEEKANQDGPADDDPRYDYAIFSTFLTMSDGFNLSASLAIPYRPGTPPPSHFPLPLSRRRSFSASPFPSHLAAAASSSSSSASASSSSSAASSSASATSSSHGEEEPLTPLLPVERFPILLDYSSDRRKDDSAFATSDYFPTMDYFARRGFAVVRVDARGVGSSQGPLLPRPHYSPEEVGSPPSAGLTAKMVGDGVEVIRQLAAFNWSTGDVGMVGRGWSATTALLLATRKPPALKAVLAVDPSDDLFYNDMTYFIDGAFHIGEQLLSMEHEAGLPQSATYPLNDAYIQQRMDNPPWLFLHLQHQRDGPFWRNESLRFLLDSQMQQASSSSASSSDSAASPSADSSDSSSDSAKASLDIPVFLIGGLFDGKRDAVPRIYQLLKQKNSTAIVKAVMGPWNNQDVFPNEVVPGPRYDWFREGLYWFRRWLPPASSSPPPPPPPPPPPVHSSLLMKESKGKDVTKKKVQEDGFTVFVRDSYLPDKNRTKDFTGKWRHGEWPIVGEDTALLRLYPNLSYGLSAQVYGKKTWHSLPDKASKGIELGSSWGGLTGDMRQLDESCLVYESEPLTKDIEIIGFPKVSLTIRTQHPSPIYSNWVVRLEDVHPLASSTQENEEPQQNVTLVTGALLNSAQRKSRSNPSFIERGQSYTFTFELHFTTWQFPVGHRLRLAISNAAFPMVWPAPFVAMTNELLVSSSDSTWLELPVIIVDKDDNDDDDDYYYEDDYDNYRREQQTTNTQEMEEREEEEMKESYFDAFHSFFASSTSPSSSSALLSSSSSLSSRPHSKVAHRKDGCWYDVGGHPYLEESHWDAETKTMTYTWKSDDWYFVKTRVIESYLEQEFKVSDENPSVASYTSLAKQFIQFTGRLPNVIGSRGRCNGLPPNYHPPDDGSSSASASSSSSSSSSASSSTSSDSSSSSSGHTSGQRTLLLVTSMNVTSDAQNFYAAFERALYANGELFHNKSWQQTFPRDFQ